jgi:hypothetical protein
MWVRRRYVYALLWRAGQQHDRRRRLGVELAAPTQLHPQPAALRTNGNPLNEIGSEVRERDLKQQVLTALLAAAPAHDILPRRRPALTKPVLSSRSLRRRAVQAPLLTPPPLILTTEASRGRG